MAQALAPLVASWRAVGRPERPEMVLRLPGSRRQQRRHGGGGGCWAPAPRQLVAAASAQQEDVEGGFCMPAYVTCDNKRSKCFTVLDIEIGDYPGTLSRGDDAGAFN